MSFYCIVIVHNKIMSTYIDSQRWQSGGSGLSWLVYTLGPRTSRQQEYIGQCRIIRLWKVLNIDQNYMFFEKLSKLVMALFHFKRGRGEQGLGPGLSTQNHTQNYSIQNISHTCTRTEKGGWRGGGYEGGRRDGGEMFVPLTCSLMVYFRWNIFIWTSTILEQSWGGCKN